MNAPAAAWVRPPDRVAARQRSIVTPEGLTLPITLASRTVRAAALMLDVMIIVISLIGFHLLLFWIAGGLLEGTTLDPTAAPQGAQEFLQILLLIFVFVTWYGYFLVQELGPRGATLGKRAVGIRIAARNGGRLAPEAVIARNLLRDIEIFYPLITLAVLLAMRIEGEENSAFAWAATGWFALFLCLPLFNRDRLRAGDIIAGTWVVEAPRAKLAETLSTKGAAAQGASGLTGARYEFGAAELSVYGEKELQVLERILREGQSEALAAVHGTICRKIGWDPGAGDERAFLEAFYAQLRSKLEADMRFGKRKADKHA